jgi:hypothetical protein
MLMELSVNSHTSPIDSVAELRQKLAHFASEQFGKSGLAYNQAVHACARF